MCGPCKQIAPALEELASEYEGEITIAKVNVDDNPISPSKFGVRGIPALFCLKMVKWFHLKLGRLQKLLFKVGLKKINSNILKLIIYF